MSFSYLCNTIYRLTIELKLLRHFVMVLEQVDFLQQDLCQVVHVLEMNHHRYQYLYNYNLVPPIELLLLHVKIDGRCSAYTYAHKSWCLSRVHPWPSTIFSTYKYSNWQKCWWHYHVVCLEQTIIHQAQKQSKY